MLCPFDCLPDPHRGHWYRDVGHAERRECVQNSAYDRWRGADCRPFAHASDAERIQIGWDFGTVRLKRRHVSRVWHRIVAVAANQWLAAAVLDYCLHEGLADALRRTAMDLTFDKQGVNDSAAIVHNDVTQQCNVPGLGIDLDHSNVRSIVKEHVLGIEEAGFIETGDHAERQVVAEVRLARDVGEAHIVNPTLWHRKHKAATPLDDDPYDLFSSLLAQACDCRPNAWVRDYAEQTVLINEGAGAPLQLVRCDLRGLIQDLACRLVHGRAADRRSARVEGACPERDRLTVALDDGNVFDGNSKYAGRNLSEAGG